MESREGAAVSPTVPYYIRARLRAALDDVAALAAEKGLGEAFSKDIDGVRCAVEGAIEANDPEAAARVLAELRVLWGLPRGSAPGSYRGE